jgi:hypothetical protein
MAVLRPEWRDNKVMEVSGNSSRAARTVLKRFPRSKSPSQHRHFNEVVSLAHRASIPFLLQVARPESIVVAIQKPPLPCVCCDAAFLVASKRRAV